MKIKLLTLIFFLSTSLMAQERFITKSGIISFEASVPSFEEIKGKNTNVSCVLNTRSGEIAVLALVRGFKFKIALMEEHFNENYIESTVFPKTTFKGKIENFFYSRITRTEQNYTLNGQLELHGKTKDISVIAKIKRTDEGIEITSNFIVSTDDFDIEIPSVVSKNISKNVKVSLEFLLK
ncbi:YceI family protein [Flavobacterium cucumis]|uniref:YceI-like domain-containing protein n=2 Tax=Flavobacterium cucumis TaxID=416016 RepID=A0A1M7ZWN3_9FLAO|nr:YceI-like domain-containing protein [Flavobacterium cucumis]